jgi:uncharacterized membrane protein
MSMSSAAGRSDAGTRRTGAIALALVAGLIGYAAATHWAVVSGRAAALGPALALTPVLAGLLWFAVRTRRSGWAKLAAVVAGLLLAALAARRAAPSLSFLYPVPSVVVYGGLLLVFGRTLAPGREAFVTRLARRVHGTLPDEITAYTRQVTWAWCLFFATMGLASLLLFAFAPLEAWSLFVNVLALPLIASMFIFEYVYRVLRYRRFSHVSLLTAVRAFHEFGRGAASPGRGS